MHDRGGGVSMHDRGGCVSMHDRGGGVYPCMIEVEVCIYA